MEKEKIYQIATLASLPCIQRIARIQADREEVEIREKVKKQLIGDLLPTVIK